MSNCARNGPESAKIVIIDDRHINAPRDSYIMEITPGTPKLNNSPRNGPESAQTVIVDDLHVSAPWGSTTMEIALGSQNGE